jgi:hypothetical protein
MKAVRLSWALLVSLCAVSALAGAGEFNVDSAFLHIRQEMDKYHASFDVYTDADAGGNHYVPMRWMNEASIGFIPNCTLPGPSGGVTCCSCSYNAHDDWCALRWVDTLGYNLTGADTCSFWAKGAVGGERLSFEVGGEPGEPMHGYMETTLTSNWARYVITLSGDLDSVRGGFCWVATRASNPGGCRFFLDDIRFNLARLQDLRFIHSYVPTSYAHDTTWALNQAYTYTNALALLSFLSRGNPDDLARASILGDAFAFAQDNDRWFQDGRLRNAYRTGDIKDRITGKVLLPGWWRPDSLRWTEDRYQVGTYTGEMAWLIIAWLTYDDVTGTMRYLTDAESLGRWVIRNCYGRTGRPGFRGGFEGPDTTPPAPLLPWKSTEHNLDLYAAFTRLGHTTDDSTWLYWADSALAFVRQMWDSATGRFWTGTQDSATIDTLGILDAQTWGLLATRDHRYDPALDWALANCRRDISGFSGFHFGAVRDGIWWEGTGQACCAFQFKAELARSDTFLGNIQDWQRNAPGGNSAAIVTCCPESIFTGIYRFWGRWYYFARRDIGATAWYLFSELYYNPFWNEPTWTPPTSVAQKVAESPELYLACSPNPFSVKDGLRVDLGSGRLDRPSVRVLDPTGRVVRVLLDGRTGAAARPLLWDGHDEQGARSVPGVYFIEVGGGSARRTRKVILTP